MKQLRHKPPAPWPLLLLFIVIFISVTVAGFIYFQNQKANLLTEKQQELSVIADLKVRQVSQWRSERIGDAFFLQGNALMTRMFEMFLRKPDPLLRSELLQSMEALTENFDYKNVLLLDPMGKVRLAHAGADTVIGDQLRPLLPEILRSRRIVLTDLHEVNSVSFTHLDLIVPIIVRERSDTNVIGFVAIRVDPSKVLRPMIGSWPVASKSAEAIMIKRQGDEIIYLNELRHLGEKSLFLRKPVSTPKLPESLAVQGINQITDGIDYRNVPVLAEMRKIPGTPWYMVAKIDREEVLAPLGMHMRMIGLIVILFILATGGLIGAYSRTQRVRYYREKYEYEQDRLALVKHFDYILKFANDIVLLFDENLTIVEANDKALESYMYSREEFIGTNMNAIRGPGKPEERLSEINKTGSLTFETVHRRRDNSIFPVEISARIVNIEGSKYYHAIGRDITQRKVDEEILRESELKFRKIFEESPFPMAMTGKDFVIFRANASFCDMLGYDHEELSSMTFRDLTHPEYLKTDELSLMKLVAGQIPIYKAEKCYIRKDGSVIWGSVTISIIRNSMNEVQLFFAMVEDITRQKEVKLQLEKSYSLLKATLESTADGLLVVDNSGRIVQYNKRFLEMWNIPPDVISTGIDEVILTYASAQLIEPDKFVDKVQKIYSESDGVNDDLLEFSDGRFFERYSQPQLINGESVGRVWSFRDVTRSKIAEKEIIAAKEKAEESDRLKTAFLQNVSHEIRTPMNAIIGFSTLLNDPEITPKERSQYSDILNSSGAQLLSIINDIVDIANIEAGQTKIRLQKVNVNATLRSINDQFSIKEKEPGVSLEVVISLKDEKANIITDNTKLIQVITNLLNNAMKFTSQGSIVFGYDLKGEFLEFFVNDTGIGIPAEHHERIFDRFFQVDGATSRHFGGTGLGLSICKAFTELLGGKIWLDSSPGQGSSFRFTIPYRIAE